MYEWGQSAGGTFIVSAGNPSAYTVRRDGTYLNQIEGTSYEDTGVKPKQTYTYQVDVKDSKGNDTPGPSVTTTTPKLPPLSKARLGGSYGVRFVFTAENYVNRSVGNKYSERWKLKPRCHTGACSTVLVTNAPGATRRSHAEGGHVPWLIHRHARDVQGQALQGDDDGDVACHQGQVIHSHWTATSFSGTSSDYSPAALGCQSGSSKSSMNGKRI